MYVFYVSGRLHFQVSGLPLKRYFAKTTGATFIRAFRAGGLTNAVPARSFEGVAATLCTIGDIGRRRLFPMPLLRLTRSTVGARRLSMLGPSILDKLREQDEKNGA